MILKKESIGLLFTYNLAGMDKLLTLSSGLFVLRSLLPTSVFHKTAPDFVATIKRTNLHSFPIQHQNG
jgi:hypothetical protein